MRRPTASPLFVVFLNGRHACMHSAMEHGMALLVVATAYRVARKRELNEKASFFFRSLETRRCGLRACGGPVCMVIWCVPLMMAFWRGRTWWHRPLAPQHGRCTKRHACETVFVTLWECLALVSLRLQLCGMIGVLEQRTPWLQPPKSPLIRALLHCNVKLHCALSFVQMCDSRVNIRLVFVRFS